jgi:hypothetical protein
MMDIRKLPHLQNTYSDNQGQKTRSQQGQEAYKEAGLELKRDMANKGPITKEDWQHLLTLYENIEGRTTDAIIAIRDEQAAMRIKFIEVSEQSDTRMAEANKIARRAKWWTMWSALSAFVAAASAVISFYWQRC